MTTTTTASELHTLAAIEIALANVEARFDSNPEDDTLRFLIFDLRASVRRRQAHLFPELPGLAA